MKIQSVIQDICGDDCKLDIFQEDNSDEIIVSGKYVEGQLSSCGDADIDTHVTVLCLIEV